MPGSAAARGRGGHNCCAALGQGRVPVKGQQLAAETTPKMWRHAQSAVDHGDVEGENHDERDRRVAGELDVVERDVHEPVFW